MFYDRLLYAFIINIKNINTMRSKYLKTLALVMAGCVLLSFIIYSCIGFTYAKFNPFDWEQGTRGVLAFFTASIFIMSFIIAAIASAD